MTSPNWREVAHPGKVEHLETGWDSSSTPDTAVAAAEDSAIIPKHTVDVAKTWWRSLVVGSVES